MSSLNLTPNFVIVAGQGLAFLGAYLIIKNLYVKSYLESEKKRSVLSSGKEEQTKFYQDEIQRLTSTIVTTLQKQQEDFLLHRNAKIADYLESQKNKIAICKEKIEQRYRKFHAELNLNSQKEAEQIKGLAEPIIAEILREYSEAV